MTSLVPENPTTLVEAAAAVRTRETTATELVSECLERIETSDGDLQAFVSVQASDALARAAELDACAETGRFAGPLHGIPVAIKDIVDVAGLPTAAGMSVEAVEATTGRPQPAACDAPPTSSSSRGSGELSARAAVTKRWKREAFRPAVRRSMASIRSDTGRSICESIHSSSTSCSKEL